MPRVLIVSCVYTPEPLVSAQISRDLASHLVEDGIEVTVLCPFPSRPIGFVCPAPNYSQASIVEQNGGVHIVRMSSYTSPQYGILSRLRESASFGFHAIRYLVIHPFQVDAVYANTWPLISQAMMVIYCWRRAVPLVMHIQDLYPESLVPKLNRCLARLLTPPLRALDRFIARHSSRLVTISSSMQQVYVADRGVPVDRVSVVPNWQDESRYEKLPEKSEACAKYSVSAELFTFLYLGNIGPVSGLDHVVRSFHVAGIVNAQLVIAGEGSARIGVEALVNSLKVRNVRFISDPNIDNVPMIQSMADVLVLPMRRSTAKSSIPSKLPAYMFSGKPILATTDLESDIAKCIRAAHCGWVGPAEDELWMAERMRKVAGLQPSLLETLGQNGRRYGFSRFSKKKGVARLAKVVVNAMNRSGDSNE